MNKTAYFALALALLSAGCARRPVKAQGPVLFRHCIVTERAGGFLSCRCTRFTMALDAKTGERVALCGD